MGQILNNLISAMLQIIAFTLIPFVFYLCRKDKSMSFSKYIGFTKPTTKSTIYVVALSVLFVLVGIVGVFINDGIKQAVLAPNSVTGNFRQMGFSSTSVVLLLIMALLKTSLSEEIFFRGFIGKQLVHKLGFKIGNIIQGIIFGSLHLLLFWLLTKTTIIPLLIIFIFSSFAGWSVGYIKEKYANGSIIPGWIAHGIGNSISYFIIAFVI